MGCNGSKIEHLEPVALCRDRCQLLESAIRHRYSLAQAHFSYLRSLASIGISLQQFFHRENTSPLPLSMPSPFPLSMPSPSPSPAPSASASSPVVSLPVESNRDPNPDPDPVPVPAPPEIPAAVEQQSVPDAGLQSDSVSDSESESVIEFPLPDDEGSAVDEIAIPSPARHYVKYMQSTSGPPFAYQAQGLGAFWDEDEMAAAAAHPYYDPTSSYYRPNGYSDYGGGFGGFDASSSSLHPPQFDSFGYFPPPFAVATAAADSSSSREPLPPPSPPRTSSWDFLNPFNAVKSFYPTYTPSRDSKELREEEGIPDLEEDDFRREIEKEEDGEEMLAEDGSGGDGGDSKKVADEAGNGTVDTEVERVADEAGNETVPEKVADEAGSGIAAAEIENVELEENLVDKDPIVNVEEHHGGSGAILTAADASGDAPLTTPGGPREVPDVFREIKEQFERASESGIEVSKMLEVGKLPYRGRNAAYKVPSKMLDVVAPPFSVVSSQPSSFRSVESRSSTANTVVNSRNLSSTLGKLYIWEKKLYGEVKAEEKLRMDHDRRFMRLKRLDERGEEAHKLLSIQISVRKLSTKMGMAIQVVDTISSKINNLRDEELWPQINELIHGLFRMWKVMLECHRNQCQIISEAANLDDIASNGNLIDAHMEATMQFELELLNWLASFYAWISAQKGYIKALNEWLMKCLNNVLEEETDDGPAPISPGRIGAPPLFDIFYQWSQAMERLAENEVFAAMQAFSMSVLQLWEQYNEEQRQRMTANNNMDRGPKVLGRNNKKMQKVLESVNKKLLMVSEQSGRPLPGQLVPHNGASRATNIANLHGLKQIFEAMEKFSEESMKVYEQLQIRSGELLAKENAKES